MLVLSEFLQVLLVVSRLLLVDAVVSSLENSEFVEEVMLCEKKDTHLIFIKKLKWNCCDFFSNMYHKVVISDTSCLEANTGFFKLLMKGTLKLLLYIPVFGQFWQYISCTAELA